MTTKLALILSGVWTLIVIAMCSGAIWFVTTIPRHEQEKRAQALGGSAATIALVGYAAIIFPWAIAFRRRREAQSEEQDDDDEPRATPRKRGRRKS